VSKRLEQGGFKWPPVMEGLMRLSPAQLAALMEGLDWTRVHVPQVLARERHNVGPPVAIERGRMTHRRDRGSQGRRIVIPCAS
jgi:transposase